MLLKNIYAGYPDVNLICLMRVSDSNLGAAGDGAGGEADGRSPADVSHPIAVSLKLLILLPLAVLLSGGGNRQMVLVRPLSISQPSATLRKSCDS